MRRNLKITEKILDHFNYLTMRRAAIKGIGAYYPDDIITNEYYSIIDIVGKRIGLPPDKIMVNIQKHGNTSAGTIPLCLYE